MAHISDYNIEKQYQATVKKTERLTPVDTEEVGAFAVLKRRTPGAGVITLARLLDLDHPGPHIAEHHGAVGPGEHTGQVEHSDAIEWAHVVQARPPSVDLDKSVFCRA